MGTPFLGYRAQPNSNLFAPVSVMWSIGKTQPKRHRTEHNDGEHKH
jgi:hypothetical protein